MIGGVENIFIDKLLSHILDGDKGSNILTAVAAALIGGHVNWSLAFRGFQSAESATELAKVAGMAILAVYGYYVGKKGKPA